MKIIKLKTKNTHTTNKSFVNLVGLHQKGAVLLESLISVLILSFGILALIGLQAVMVKATSASEYRSDAIFIAQQQLGMMWANPANLNAYAVAAPGADISNLLPNGRRIVTVNAPPVVGDPVTEVNVTITWQAPDEDMHTYTTTARITS